MGIDCRQIRNRWPVFGYPAYGLPLFHLENTTFLTTTFVNGLKKFDEEKRASLQRASLGGRVNECLDLGGQRVRDLIYGRTAG